MGKRHQAYMIAKVAGRYCCIAGVHNQWLYGFSVLYKCFQFISHVKTPVLRPMIKHHIHHTVTVQDELRRSVKPTALEVNVELFESSQSNVDNNDGITVIDVTDLEAPRYCFVSIDGLEGRAAGNIPVDVPLSAETYVRAYYPKEIVDVDNPPVGTEQDAISVEKNVRRAIDLLQDFAVLTMEPIKEAWPDVDWKAPNTTESAEVIDQVGETKQSRQTQKKNELQVSTLRLKSLTSVLDSLVDGASPAKCENAHHVLSSLELNSFAWDLLQGEPKYKVPTILSVLVAAQPNIMHLDLSSAVNVDPE
ncbi:hypothetical protein HK102_000279 [Quaeritorhiza haematococci]|nr:hypothetical protein HK102_000279 [Quaeritorhiza haematococci]